MRQRKGRIEGDGPSRDVALLRLELRRSRHAVVREEVVHVGEAAPGLGFPGIDHRRVLEVAEGLEDSFFRPLVQEEPPPLHPIPRLGVVRTTRDAPLLLGGQRGPEHARNARGEVRGGRHGVPLPVRDLSRPEVSPASDVHELGVHVDVPSLAANAAHEDRACAEGAARGARVAARRRARVDGRACQDREPRRFREVIDERARNAFGEIFVCGVAGLVRERQDGEDVGRRRGGAAGEEVPCGEAEDGGQRAGGERRRPPGSAGTPCPR